MGGKSIDTNKGSTPFDYFLVPTVGFAQPTGYGGTGQCPAKSHLRPRNRCSDQFLCASVVG